MNAGRLTVALLVAWSASAIGGCRVTGRSAAQDAQPAHAATQPAAPVVLTDNDELRMMFEADQGERLTDNGKIDWTVVAKNDQRRQARVLELEDDGLIRTGNDYFHAAMIFQHGMKPEDYERAHRYAKQGVELGSPHPAAKWLIAATWDRWQMAQKRPQWYGTQYIRETPDGPLRLYTIDESAVTDDERRALDVPTLAEAYRRLAETNGERAEAPSP